MREKLVASKANQLLIVVKLNCPKLKSIFSFTGRGSTKRMEASSGGYFRNEWQFLFKMATKKLAQLLLTKVNLIPDVFLIMVLKIQKILKQR